jgi:hypothetical protein
MNDIEQKAEFYAKLANIEDLESLPSVEKEQLMVDAVKVGLLSSVFYAPKNKRLPKDVPAAWFWIAGIHPWARRLIGDLVDTGETDVRELDKTAMANHWRPEVLILDKAVHGVVPRHTMNGTAYDGLMEVVYSRPFPFSRCQKCGNIFVPAKNQKYCGKSCATKALAPWKNRYMKKYMKERRAHGNK